MNKLGFLFIWDLLLHLLITICLCFHLTTVLGNKNYKNHSKESKDRLQWWIHKKILNWRYFFKEIQMNYFLSRNNIAFIKYTKRHWLFCLFLPTRKTHLQIDNKYLCYNGHALLYSGIITIMSDDKNMQKSRGRFNEVRQFFKTQPNPLSSKNPCGISSCFVQERNLIQIKKLDANE